jgi:nucleoside-diphosphate-sugar epimerase
MDRDVVLVVGSTGYFGTGVVRELVRRRSTTGAQAQAPCRGLRWRLRLLGRSSRAGFKRAGYLPSSNHLGQQQQQDGGGGEQQQQQETKKQEPALECVVCDDTTDINAYRNDWFRDVQVVVCVARPRGVDAPKEREREQESYRRMVENLCRMAASHRVFPTCSCSDCRTWETTRRSSPWAASRQSIS